MKSCVIHCRPTSLQTYDGRGFQSLYNADLPSRLLLSRVPRSTQRPRPEKRAEQPVSSQEEEEWTTVKKRLPEKKRAGGLFSQQLLPRVRRPVPVAIMALGQLTPGQFTVYNPILIMSL